MNVIKLQWKKEVIDYLRSVWSTSDIWVDIDMFGSRNSYCKRFDVPFFVIKRKLYDMRHEQAPIIEPIDLNSFTVDIRHVQPYFEFSIPDEVFE